MTWHVVYSRPSFVPSSCIVRYFVTTGFLWPRDMLVWIMDKPFQLYAFSLTICSPDLPGRADLLLPYIILNVNRRAKNRGRPGNEACNPAFTLDQMHVSSRSADENVLKCVLCRGWHPSHIFQPDVVHLVLYNNVLELASQVIGNCTSNRASDSVEEY